MCTVASPALDRVAHGRPLIRAGAATQDGDVLFPTCPAEGFVLHKRATQRAHGHSVYGHPHCSDRKPANTPRSAVPTESPPFGSPDMSSSSVRPVTLSGPGEAVSPAVNHSYQHINTPGFSQMKKKMKIPPHREAHPPPLPRAVPSPSAMLAVARPSQHRT